MSADRQVMSPGECAELACLLEVTARKPGNVHSAADFDDVGYLDFVFSATAIRPVLERAGALGIGATVLECVRRTRERVRTNTNLGMVLLMAPLAAVPPDRPLKDGVRQVLEETTIGDARAVYEAIRLAKPGGLGGVPEQDVADPPTEPLVAVMRRAAQRDLVARQYANGFREVFCDGVPALAEALARGLSWEQSIIRCHLELLARHPDTLIARKRGHDEASESARRAAEVLAAGWPATEEAERLMNDFDAWLRAVGHARNPGATADLVAACLFIALRDGTIQPLNVRHKGCPQTSRPHRTGSMSTPEQL